MKSKPQKLPPIQPGTRFGRWVVLSLSHKNRWGSHYTCRCDCLVERVVPASNLLSGATLSCGCLARELSRERRLAAASDPIGERFGALVVESYSHRGPKGGSYYLCRCDCGNATRVLRGNLGRNCRSCGCLSGQLTWTRRRESMDPPGEMYIPEPNTGCWLWLGDSDDDGYGRLRRTEVTAGSKRRRTTRAHRFFWETHRGPIGPGLFVLHRCDTPACVNPSHLFLGTKMDNCLDMISKGRAAWQKKTRAA